MIAHRQFAAKRVLSDVYRPEFVPLLQDIVSIKVLSCGPIITKFGQNILKHLYVVNPE